MPDKPNTSNFAISSAVLDTAVTLGVGAENLSTTLAEDIDDTETEVMHLADATGMLFSGVIVINNEKIFYGERYGNGLRFLTRGFDGSTAAAHTAGDDVEQLGLPKHDSKAQQD